jgi:HK97 gp10 family phage protein
MADAEFKLEGIEELVTNNGKLVLELGPIVRDLLHKCVFTIERNAKLRTPIDTGRLMSSLSARTQKFPGDNASQIGPGQVPEWGQVGTNVNYARFVEFGTKNMKAQPYLTPGLEASKSDIDVYIEEATKKIEATWQ